MPRASRLNIRPINGNMGLTPPSKVRQDGTYTPGVPYLGRTHAWNANLDEFRGKMCGRRALGAGLLDGDGDLRKVGPFDDT